jgi:hypothetical protein
VKRELSLAGKVFWMLPVTDDKFRGSDNFFNKYDYFGTYVGNQVPCQLLQDFE